MRLPEAPGRSELLREGERIMMICNACRYCEGYCAVFPAMERRRQFPAADLNYLANLCHNCGECLYACQYAPPHEFAINVPRTFAQIRLQTYEAYAWPGALASAFRRQGVATSLWLSAAFIGVMVMVTAVAGSLSLTGERDSAEFYAVLPHHVMVTLFGGVFTFALAALAVGLVRFQRDMRDAERRGSGSSGGARKVSSPRPSGIAASWTALRDALTLRYLHGHGEDCTYTGEEHRSPWRRRFHHLTFYGFVLCFASTTVAAIYHLFFGWEAPYAYTSLPVVLGTLGGIGLVAGPIGLYRLGGRRDLDTADPAQPPLDRGFVLLLVLTSATGLLLLAFRHTAAMPALLIVHLGVVLALFVTLPYGKFVHGIYRTAALAQNAREGKRL
jgi:citrate/tricarballylate utilization protein